MNNCITFNTKNKTEIDLQQKLFDNKKQWTLMLWVNVYDFTTNADISIISQSISGSQNRYTLAICKDHCLYTWNCNYGQYIKLKSNLKENTPFHITIINNKGVYKFYVNGEFKLEKYYEMSDTNTILGSYLNYQHITGSFDNFKIYNKILNDSEIKASIHKNDTNMKDLLMYYNFNTIKEKDDKKYIIDISKNYKDLEITNFYKLDKTFVKCNKYIVQKDNKHYTINIQQIDCIDDESFKNKSFNSLYELITYNDNNIIPLDYFDKFKLLIYKE